MGLKRVKQPVLLNSKGEPIILNALEKRQAGWLQRQINERFGNDLGYEIPVTTLTTISKKISEQTFYTIPFALYVPTVVGQGTWSSSITTYRSFVMGDAFETGLIDLGGQNTRLASADAGVDALTVPVKNWAKEIGWSIPELQEAAKSGNWDLVSAKEEARKENWDLGLQKIAFLGVPGLSSVLGLLTQPNVTVNTTIITKYISTMTSAELKTFCGAVYQAYRTNCNYTRKPTHFIVPEADYNGMAAQTSPDFPILTIKQLLENMFKEITGDQNFKVMPCVYAQADQNASGKNIYTLLHYNEKSVRMDIPVDYTNTLANSVNNFQFQNAGYGQFTGVLAYRPLEMLYFQF